MNDLDYKLISNTFFTSGEFKDLLFLCIAYVSVATEKERHSSLNFHSFFFIIRKTVNFLTASGRK